MSASSITLSAEQFAEMMAKMNSLASEVETLKAQKKQKKSPKRSPKKHGANGTHHADQQAVGKLLPYQPHLCDCRVWNSRLGTQCTRRADGVGVVCASHMKPEKQTCGMYNEAPPQNWGDYGDGVLTKSLEVRRGKPMNFKMGRDAYLQAWKCMMCADTQEQVEEQVEEPPALNLHQLVDDEVVDDTLGDCPNWVDTPVAQVVADATIVPEENVELMVKDIVSGLITRACDMADAEAKYNADYDNMSDVEVESDDDFEAELDNVALTIE